jgi:hypothetical protein
MMNFQIDIPFEEACRLIASYRLAVGSSGNLSVKSSSSIRITPSGHWFEYPISIDTAAWVNLDGSNCFGKPSVETPMHIAVYQTNPSITTQTYPEEGKLEARFLLHRGALHVPLSRCSSELKVYSENL